MAMGMKSRVAFAGRNVRAAPVARPVRARSSVAVKAMIKQWPDPEFTKQVLAAFPDQGIANVEEARVLYEHGYTYLDVRPTIEYQDVGKVKNSVNIPIVNMTKKYNAADRKFTYEKAPNAAFVEMVQKKFPKKDAKLLVACSDGRSYCIDALEALDEAGYTNLAGLRGGYYAWFKVFDNKLSRRRYGEYAEDYSGQSMGGDSCGIHASGAGFEKVDKIEAWVPPKY
mmetsp:Transcript_14762/g.36827  ORF Transcript_14762/g.36827 Transcript_14762/m.36827 type:complete len:226 (-) Transcript_14762:486-1163(-)|eukprot:CAMPEP_0202865340 /NCGR_PEP_ID=MMETSP1391-20130828/5749_1 /ASSEMBLY_ACC=CAM_ASM_000867 /TAXON_ID=1034604 /ORGANISM="Chlamydomonas leiostraca, Strain SAG 11-49" /LENGTH=225 /DNA_ID=CAMNT_0049545173 /DNA_START=81 /DNA_END=758 /DNA_ORIENTATION=+